MIKNINNQENWSGNGSLSVSLLKDTDNIVVKETKSRAEVLFYTKIYPKVLRYGLPLPKLYWVYKKRGFYSIGISRLNRIPDFLEESLLYQFSAELALLTKKKYHKLPFFHESLFFLFDDLKLLSKVRKIVNASPLSLIHGDLSWRNLGFEKKIKIFDWGGLSIGLPAGDLHFIFSERDYSSKTIHESLKIGMLDVYVKEFNRMNKKNICLESSLVNVYLTGFLTREIWFRISGDLSHKKDSLFFYKKLEQVVT